MEDELMNDAIAAQVRDANRRFYDALEALDMDAMAAVWAGGDDVVCIHPGGPVQRGWDEVGGAWEAIMSHTGYIEFEIDDVNVVVQDPVAWVTCVERITSSTGEGATAVAEVAATNVFVLDATGWRLQVHHASPIIRPGLGDEEQD
jgi:ketosteroid isomerase-like protein